ncbi:hypothetical protein EDC04DRAFT_2661318, partial [Pisolithus marmoratus]
MEASLGSDIQGPFLIGPTINIFLYGVTTRQVYLYFTQSKRDGVWLRSLLVSFLSSMLCAHTLAQPSIALLYLAEPFNCIVSIYYIYNALVTHFGDEANLLTGNWAFTA